VTFIGDYVALENNFWKESGLEIQIQPGGFEHDAIKLVASGADAFGVSSGPQLLQARANGVPVVAIGSTIPRSPIGWISKKESNIKTPFDFVGKKVGAQFGTHTEITFEALCKKNKIDIKSIDRVPVKFDPRPFVTGDIDVLPVYIIDQPVDLASQGIELNIIDPGDYGVSLFYGNLYFTTENFVKNNPELVKKFLEGASKGWVWADKHNKEAVEILLKSVPDANREILNKKLNVTLNFIKKNGQPYKGVFPTELKDWQTTYKLLKDYGEITDDVELTKIFTNQFLPERKF